MDFKKEWFVSEKYWFSKDHLFDKYITEKYSYLLEGSCPPTTIQIDFVTQILIYDQLPRHVYRNEQAVHIIEYYLQKALMILSNNIKELDNLADTEWIFAMLPVRHSKNRIDILKVVQLAWNRLDNNPESTWIKKFLRASYSQLNSLTIRRQYEPLVTGAPVSNTNIDDFITILERGYFPGNDSNYKNIANVVVGGRNPLVVSLSGGVDSMVALEILRKQTKNIVAVHINYCNRDTSYSEAEFVNWWCNQIGVKLYTRHITEFTRKQAKDYGLRDIYEEYTKNVRFNSYVTAAKLSGFDEFKVVLGHNKDDTFENILTNITAQNKWDNLLGMKLYGTINGTFVYRPLINTSKSTIRSYSRKYNIPYLYDSTTDICQRGKIRTNIVPVLNKWDPNCINSMYVMSDIMQDLYINNKVLIRMFVSEFNEKCYIECDKADLSESIIFWREFFNDIRIQRPSNKSLINYINKIKIIKSNWTGADDQCKIVLTSKNIIEFNYISTGKIYIYIR
jgi:tRNA(Ile)-lysidine synthetase-like protein